MIGIDEVGRGALAFEVYACACYFEEDALWKSNFDVAQIQDSKKILPKKRKIIYEQLSASPFVKYAIGTASVEEIESMNILNATLLAMERAYFNLGIFDATLFIDGNKKPSKLPQAECVIGGDSKIIQIAAASIIAKVIRDEAVQNAAPLFPEYKFEVHKGYGTKAHFEAIKKHGPLNIHRKSFLKNLAL